MFLRLHWAKRKRLVDEWHRDVFFLCREAKIDKAESIHVEATVRYPDRRKRDTLNLISPLDKLVFDGLVKAGVISDDDPEHLTWGVPRIEHGPPAVILTLEPKKPPPSDGG
jgi:hypothetical protein